MRVRGGWQAPVPNTGYNDQVKRHMNTKNAHTHTTHRLTSRTAPAAPHPCMELRPQSPPTPMGQQWSLSIQPAQTTQQSRNKNTHLPRSSAPITPKTFSFTICTCIAATRLLLAMAGPPVGSGQQVAAGIRMFTQDAPVAQRPKHKHERGNKNHHCGRRNSCNAKADAGRQQQACGRRQACARAVEAPKRKGHTSHHLGIRFWMTIYDHPNGHQYDWH